MVLLYRCGEVEGNAATSTHHRDLFNWEGNCNGLRVFPSVSSTTGGAHSGWMAAHNLDAEQLSVDLKWGREKVHRAVRAV